MPDSVRRVPARQRRIFIGLSEVAGHYSSIEAGMKELGVDAHFFNLSPDVFAFRATDSSSLGRLRWLRSRPESSLAYRTWKMALRLNRVVRRLRAVALFPWAIARYDAFIIGGHETFLGGLDLQILKRLRKPVVVIFTGTDHRPPFLSGVGIRFYRDPNSLASASRRLSRRVRRAEANATAIIALPTSAQYHRRPFYDFLSVGIPFAQPQRSSKSSADARGPVRILHCPTDPIAKGSDRVRRAVERCRASGIEVEYRELVGRPNREVLDALQWCDFVVDEVFSDTAMAKFGTEAASYGKPAIVGSYANALLESRRDRPPSYLCNPDDLDSAVMALASDREAGRALGILALDFVTTQWAPSQVAMRVLQIMDGTAPRAWRIDPKTLSYVHGWGLDESTLRRTVRDLLANSNFDELGIPSDTPVRDALRALIERSSNQPRSP